MTAEVEPQATRGLLDQLVDGLAVAFFGLMFVLVLAQIVCRYGFDEPLVWSEEAARYLFVWVALLGWTVAARRGSHIAITGVVDRLPPAGARFMRLAAQLAMVIFAFLLLWFGTSIASRNIGVPTVTLPFDFWLVYLAAPVAAAALLLDSAVRISTLLRGQRP